MKAVGIVSEYNPFHLGHQYHINATRLLCPEHAVVAVMSGDFVQRGESAAFDKHIRAKAAVLGGADLVLELPLPWALSSAEGFARGAVGLLGQLGVVDTLSFGSECGDSALMREMALALSSDDVNELIAARLSAGVSYAAARQSALEAVLGDGAEAIARPNNILGVEYIRAIDALGLDMRVVTVARTGAGHDEKSREKVRSASDLRSMMYSDEPWLQFMPDSVREVYTGELPLNREKIQCAVLSRLRWLDREDFCALEDATEGLGNKLWKAVQEGESVEDILKRAKSKRYAMSRLRRMLMCASLGLKSGMNSGVPGYARVLAANTTGLSLLSDMKKVAGVPVITKPAHGLLLEGDALQSFELTRRARELYAIGMAARATPAGDMRSSPFILKDSAPNIC